MTKIKLESYDGIVSECDLEAVKMMILIKDMIENTDCPLGDDQKPIVLNNEALTDEVLKKVIQWCEYHFDDPPPDDDFDEDKDRRNEELSHWDKTFIDISDRGLLFDIIIAANYLDIKGLIEVGAKHICNKIKGKSCKEVRDILNINNDFKPEEEEAIHQENKWIHAKD